MPRREFKLNSFNAVGAGQTATLNVPRGSRYFNIKLLYKGTANQATIESDITAIRIKTNGKVQRDLRVDELFKMLAINGVAFEAGVIPLYFSEPWRRNVAGEDGLAWATADLDTFQIEVDIASGATSPTLEAYAVTDNAVGKLMNIIKVRREVIPVTQAGLVTVNTMSTRPEEIYQRLHCFEAAANDITEVQIKQDQYEAINIVRKINDLNMKDHGLTPQSDIFTIAFDKTQRIEDGLPMVYDRGNVKQRVQDFRVEFQLANASTFTIVKEMLGDPD